MPKVSCHSLYPASRALTPQHTSGAEVRSVLAPPPASWRRHTWICRGGATWRRIRRTHPVTPSPPTPPSPDLEGWGALPDSPALYPTPPRVQGCSRRGSVHPSLSSESFAKRGYCSKRKPLGPSTITGVSRPKPTPASQQTTFQSSQGHEYSHPLANNTSLTPTRPFPHSVSQQPQSHPSRGSMLLLSIFQANNLQRHTRCHTPSCALSQLAVLHTRSQF